MTKENKSQESQDILIKALQEIAKRSDCLNSSQLCCAYLSQIAKDALKKAGAQ
jgi:hypothetical protein